LAQPDFEDEEGGYDEVDDEEVDGEEVGVLEGA
jgi:hypothetical protein